MKTMSKGYFDFISVFTWKLLTFMSIMRSKSMRSKSMDWFLYDNGLRLERVNAEYVNVATFPQ